MSDHRIPAENQWYLDAKKRPGSGHCRGCEKLLPRKDGKPSRNRSWCDGECQERYKIHSYGGHWRREYIIACSSGVVCRVDYADPSSGWSRYWGSTRCRCPGCSTMGAPEEFEADHRVPLGMVDRSDPEHWRFWLIDNMQGLCTSCHRAKTTLDVRNINAARKGLRNFVRWADRNNYDPSAPIISTHNTDLFHE